MTKDRDLKLSSLIVTEEKWRVEALFDTLVAVSLRRTGGNLTSSVRNREKLDSKIHRTGMEMVGDPTKMVIVALRQNETVNVIVVPTGKEIEVESEIEVEIEFGTEERRTAAVDQ